MISRFKYSFVSDKKPEASRVFYYIAIFIILTFIIALPVARGTQGTFLVLSDFHCDATANPVIKKNDTSPALFASLAQKINELAQDGQLKPDFVIIPGDFLAHEFGKHHDFNHQDIQQTLRVPLAMVDAALKNHKIGDAGIFPAIGNNDSYCGDYCTSLHKLGSLGNFFFDTEKTWEPYTAKNNPDTDFRSKFIRGGYYSATLMQQYPQNKIIVINNIPFATASANPHSDSNAEEYNQYIIAELNYLEEKLAQYHQEKDNVILVYHIPNFEMFAWNNYATSLKNKYGNSLVEVLKKYRSTISVIITGHAHVNLLAIAPQKNLEGIPIEVVGSIAPTFTPTFDIFHYDRTTGVINQEATEVFTYNKDSNTWVRSPSLGIH
jgi:sphingomyelin phosphodiesterase acid-like 3